MLKRSLVVLSLTTILIIGAAPIPAVHGIVPAESEMLMLDTPDTPQQPDATDKGGNGVAKVLTAPFKAIGRIFGIGRKQDNKLHRLSEKDVKKFETDKTVKVVDARTAPVIDGTPVTASNDGGVTTQSQ